MGDQRECMGLARKQAAPLHRSLQVERELAVRRAAGGGFRNAPPLVGEGSVALCQRGAQAVGRRLTGAPAVASRLLGAGLVQQGVLPVLPAHELEVLLKSMTLAVEDLQAQGIHHNDINPRNMGLERSEDGSLQACYSYDLGAASGAPGDTVTRLLKAQPSPVCLEALLSQDLSLVSDLEFGSAAAVAGRRLQPGSDLESLLFCCIGLLGEELPWSAAAATADGEEVLRLREAAAEDPSSLPGFAGYPAPLQALAITLLSGRAS